jgi:ribosomal-protein-alanine N-acetyltransferase
MNCMTALQTSRLNLRPFSQGDLNDLAPLMANADFMRFSLGVFSREQTAGFLEKVRGRDREGLPSQFALIFRAEQKLIGYCGFFLQTVNDHPDNIASRRVAEKNGMIPEKETVFRVFPAIVFGINPEQRNRR